MVLHDRAQHERAQLFTCMINCVCRASRPRTEFSLTGLVTWLFTGLAPDYEAVASILDCWHKPHPLGTYHSCLVLHLLWKNTILNPLGNWTPLIPLVWNCVHRLKFGQETSSTCECPLGALARKAFVHIVWNQCNFFKYCRPVKF